jgi:outer membrane lipoprotein-sorting protein
LIREFEVVESTGVTRHIRITGLEPNAPVERSSFTFTPPKGVKIVDQTKP